MINKIKDHLFKVGRNLVSITNTTFRSTYDDSGNQVGMSIQANVKNYLAQNYNFSNVSILTPYGFMSIPPDQTVMEIKPLGLSNQNPSLGNAVNVIPSSYVQIIDPKLGDSLLFCNNWVLKVSIDGILAKFFQNPSYSATLISGEWANKIDTDIINSIISLINQLDSNYTSLKNAFDTHVHSDVQSGNDMSGVPTLGLSQTNISVPNSLTEDLNYISNGNTLLNPNAIEVPS